MNPLISSTQGAELVAFLALFAPALFVVWLGYRRGVRRATTRALETHQRLNRCPECGHGEDGPR